MVIKVDDNTFRFIRLEDFNTSYHDYPRATDPIGQWVKIYNVTTNTFDIQVLNSVPSTTSTAHTFISAVANSITALPSRSKLALLRSILILALLLLISTLIVLYQQGTSSS